MRTMLFAVLVSVLTLGSTLGVAAAEDSCRSKAIGKDGRPLAGAALSSFLTRCARDACEPKAIDKNGKALSGAAKDSFVQRCSLTAKRRRPPTPLRNKVSENEASICWNPLYRADGGALRGACCPCPTKDHQGVQGRMAGQQSGESGEANYRSGIHSPMSRWYVERRNATASSHRNVPRNHSGDRAADEFGSDSREPYWRQPVRV